MRRAKDRPTVVVDGYTRFCLTGIMVLLTLLLIGLWAGGPGLVDESGAAARAAEKAGKGIPDSGAQRMAIIRESQSTNRKLDTIISLLQSGKLEVVVTNLEAGDAARKATSPSGK